MDLDREIAKVHESKIDELSKDNIDLKSQLLALQDELQRTRNEAEAGIERYKQYE